jgi:glyoxylase-like metal-dependent hydrolase (beta-lactamase superfamily II)
MGKVREIAEKLWTGAETTAEVHPLVSFFGIEELGDRLAFISSFANIGAIDSGDGLILIDTGTHFTAGINRDQLRGWSDRPVHTAVYTHGHVDHVMGMATFDREAAGAGAPRPRVIAHERVVDRFDRYRLTAGYNASINARQFQVSRSMWPTDYRAPDETYRERLELAVGDVSLELFHDRGETDDHTWVWWADRKVLFTGDLFIWASPNCGNPQKAQRYPREWAAALEKMAALEPELLLPGHGPPIIGADRCRQALAETAALLRSITEQTLALMNDGARLDAVIAGVAIPAELLERPYLRPVYDEPAFIVRNLWRLYGGWYDGNPARLKPASDGAVAREVAELAGGVDRLVERAGAATDVALACQLIEWAWQASPDDGAVNAARIEIYKRRAAAESSLMAKSIYLGAARESGD